jgi:hypothetical protein
LAQSGYQPSAHALLPGVAVTVKGRTMGVIEFRHQGEIQDWDSG